MLKASQQFQADRLAQPKKKSVERFADLEKRETNFLRTSQQFAMFSHSRKMGSGSPSPSPAKLMNSQSTASKTLMDGRKNSFSQMMINPLSDENSQMKQIRAIEKHNILGSESRNVEGDSDFESRHRRNNTYTGKV